LVKRLWAKLKTAKLSIEKNDQLWVTQVLDDQLAKWQSGQRSFGKKALRPFILWLNIYKK
jgi:hypothetical protein